MGNKLKTIVLACTATVLAGPAVAAFHFMQIEQVLGGISGDTALQAVQLRLRSGGQTQVSGKTLIAYDAAGQNPVTLITFPDPVAVGTAGSRILATTAEFAMSAAGPDADFILDSPIPAAYLPAGRLTFQNGSTILWSLSWGGAAYTGSTTGAVTNDADGDFGPPFAQALPSAAREGLLFQGAANALSVTNAGDYALTGGPALLTNNAGESAQANLDLIHANGFE